MCSQSTAYDFSRGPWLQMINDLELNHADPISPLQVFNIKWVLRRASLRGQACVRKVPFLAVLVHSLDVTHNDATAVLKDPTGKQSQSRCVQLYIFLNFFVIKAVHFLHVEPVYNNFNFTTIVHKVTNV